MVQVHQEETRFHDPVHFRSEPVTCRGGRTHCASPAELVAHQERVRNLAEREPLGVFLHELLPEMYPQPAERELIQIELEPLQPSLFGEPQFCEEDVA